MTIARKSQEVGGGSLFFLSPPSLSPSSLVFPLYLHFLSPGYGTFVHHLWEYLVSFSALAPSLHLFTLSAAIANWKGAQVPGQAPPCDDTQLDLGHDRKGPGRRQEREAGDPLPSQVPSSPPHHLPPSPASATRQRHRAMVQVLGTHYVSPGSLPMSQ